MEEAKAEILKLKEEMKIKVNEFGKSVAEFKRRESLMNQQKKKDSRRPQELMESSESETSYDEEEEMVRKRAKNVIFVLVILNFLEEIEQFEEEYIGEKEESREK